MESLRVDFYDSGIGDTIIITFPGGAIGVVDAHPSPSGNRPDILGITGGKCIRFVCLTHPHRDHGADLVELVKNHPEIEEFWHTVSDVQVFVSCIRKITSFQSEVCEIVKQMVREQASFVAELYSAVQDKGIKRKKLHSAVECLEFDGVKVHFLSPEEDVLNSFTDTYACEDLPSRMPDYRTQICSPPS